MTVDQLETEATQKRFFRFDAWEYFLLVVGTLLYFQLVPDAWACMSRNRSQLAWLIATMAILLLLLLRQQFSNWRLTLARPLMKILIVTVLLLVIQAILFVMFPQMPSLSAILDPRNWSYGMWLGASFVFLGAVCLYGYFTEWSAR